MVRYGHGVDRVISEELPNLAKIFHKPVMANVSGFSVDEYVETCRRLDAPQYCFYRLFDGQSGISGPAPRLPATTLAEHCYDGMFYGCTGLTHAPELPALALAPNCYREMFKGCTKLAIPPELPATALAIYCYHDMFGECTALTAAPELPATQLAEGCYQGMFGVCTALTAAPALPATQLADYCYQAMFEYCTALTAAPALPATQLANQCYQHMFYHCINLSSVTCLATDFMYVTDCTFDWLDDVAENGTFYKAADTFWEHGPSGIPDFWTVVEVAP